MTSNTDYPIVIVGTGFAGYAVAREVRRRDRSIGMLMLSREDGNQYSKPMLSNAFAQKKTPEQLVSSPAATMVVHAGIAITGWVMLLAWNSLG